MAEAARDLGHEYLALTDPLAPADRGQRPQPGRLRGPEAGRVAELNERLAPFRILTGIEVDILGAAPSTRPTSCWAAWMWWWPASLQAAHAAGR